MSADNDTFAATKSDFAAKFIKCLMESGIYDEMVELEEAEPLEEEEIQYFIKTSLYPLQNNMLK